MADGVKRIVEIAIRANSSGAMRGVDDLVKKVTGLTTAHLAFAAAAVAALTQVAQAYARTVTAAQGYQKAILEVNTLLNADSATVQRMSRDLQELSVRFGQVDEVMARAQYNVVSAGFSDVADSMKILEIASKAAIGGVTDVNTAASVLTQTLNAYGLGAESAEEVAGTLFATVKGGVTTFTDLAANLGKVTSTAASAGVSFDEVAAAIAVMTKNGVATAQATSSLNALIIAIGAASGESKEKLDALGISLDKGLAPALAAIDRAADGNLSVLRELIPSVEGLRAATSAGANGARQMVEQLGAATNGVNDFNDAYATMAESAAQAQARYEAAQQRLDMAIGSTGLAGKAAALEGMAEGANAQAEALEENAGSLAAIATALGETWGWLNKINGEVEAFVAAAGAETLGRLMFGELAWSAQKAANAINAAADATARLGGLPLDDPTGGATLGPFSPETATTTADLTSGVQGAAASLGISLTSVKVNDDGSWEEVDRSLADLRAEIESRVTEILGKPIAAAPVIAKDFSVAGDAGTDEADIQLLEDVLALEAQRNREREIEAAFARSAEEGRALQRQFWAEEQDALAKRREREAEINEELANRAKVTAEAAEAMATLKGAATAAGDRIADLGAQSLSAFIQGRGEAVRFGTILRTIVVDALSAVIVKLLIIRTLKAAFGLPFADGGTVPGGAFGMQIPRAAAGMTIPLSTQPGMDSALIAAMPGEGVIRRDTMLRLERFLSATENAAAVSPASLTSGVVGTQVINYNIARPVSWRDHLDLGVTAAAAQRDAARSVL